MRDGKDAALANRRQSLEENQHSAANAFVKSEQAKQAQHAGKRPMLEGEYMEFNACMMNNGNHAQMLGKHLTKGIDEVAYPVREALDHTQKS